MAAASTQKTRQRKSHRPAHRVRRLFQPSLESLEPRLALAASLTVNSVLDSNTRDGFLTLREAILVNNRTLAVGSLSPGELAQVSGTPTATDADTIAFNVGGGGVQTIAPTSALPTITDPVTIDGTTQPGFAGSPIIELSGASAGNANGLLIRASNSTVRGLVINSFQSAGVAIAGAGAAGAQAVGNRVQGCYIGTDASGTLPRGNFRGVLLGDFVLRTGTQEENFIGTDGDGFNDVAERNIISGNIEDGVRIILASLNNVVAGNYIGTDVTGTMGLGNGYPGGGRGIQIAGGPQGNRIGTDGNGVSDALERNVISGNRGVGILIGNPGTDNNIVAGNYIGTDYTGTAGLSNWNDGNSGIVITDGAQGNRVGGADPALGNTIAFNACKAQNGGVRIGPGGTTTGNRIQGNSIHSNCGLGIDLTNLGGPDGVTPNDAGDGDPGPNNLQNFPVLTVAHSGPQTFVAGTLNSLPGTTFTLDFYASPAADPSGYGEGARYLGSTTWATDGAGNASFEVLLDAATVAGEVVTATTTAEPSGDTSEFSAAVPVTDLVVNGTFGDEEYSFSAHSIGTVQVLQVSLFGVPLPDGMAAQVFVSDPGGSDTYTVNFGGWDGVVSIDDQGTTVNDNLIVNGTIGDDSLNKQSGFVSWRPLGDTGPYRATVNFSGFGDTGDTVTLIAGSGDDTIHDPGTNTLILGGPGDDTIVIDATSGNGVVVDGGDGSDAYIVNFGSLAGPVTVADSGTTGVDSLAVEGTPGPDAFLLTGSQVQNGAEAIIIASPLANLTVAGGGGSDSTTIDGFTAPTTNLAVDGSGGTNAVTIVGSPPPGVTIVLTGAVQTVQLDVNPNSLNLASNGIITVALFTTPGFDAANVDVSSVLFAGAHAAQNALADVDGDGDLDLVLHFRTQDTNLRALYEQLLADDIDGDGVLDSSHQELDLSLTGQTIDSVFFEGFDNLDLFLAGKALRELLRDLAAAGSI